jgi:hypothetical protein
MAKKLSLKERRERQTAEGAVEMIRYIAESERLIALTRKLRAERLAREATNPPTPKKRYRKKKPTAERTTQ